MNKGVVEDCDWSAISIACVQEEPESRIFKNISKEINSCFEVIFWDQPIP